MSKNLLKVNGKEYHSYKEFCDDYDIDFKEFYLLKRQAPNFDIFWVLEHYFQVVFLRLRDKSIIVRNKIDKPHT